MADSNIDDLAALEPTRVSTPPADLPPPPPAQPVKTVVSHQVDINYPDPTLLSVIIKDVAKWSGHSFVMDPAVNVKLQIFSAHKMPAKDAYDLFLASLSVVNLRAVQIGAIVKIVPLVLVVAA